jgi:hypothetical protein
MKNTKIINLTAGPGTGKSTSASYLYYLLKSKQYSVELVREYVKAWAYEERPINNYDQIYFLGKQTRYESQLYGKVDYIVTDSPVMLGVYYAQKYCSPVLAEGVKNITLALYEQAAEDGHTHINVFLNRSKPYVKLGRYQNEEQAKQIDKDIKKMLDELKFEYIESETSEEDLNKLFLKIAGGPNE